MVVGVATDLQFKKFCSILDLGSLPGDPRFVSNKERCANQSALFDILQDKIGQKT